MKPSPKIQSRAYRRNVRGFTLVEMVIAVGTFAFLVGAIVCLQLFALRIYTLAATKLTATQGGREALNQIREQIREGKIVYVGTCSNTIYSSFQLITNTMPQQGNALIIYPTTNTSWCSIYYLDTSTTTNGLVQFNTSNTCPPGSCWITTYTNILAQYITNQLVFDARSWQNQIISNYQCLDNRMLIEVTMQFSQWEYPIAFAGTNGGANAYDYYQLRTRVFRRAWN
ncbi:MAG: prepilin-type N-terminal cleavage/methylation domain-containing protein [Verrucomicrobiota bacterium]